MFSATKGGSPSGYQISRSVRLRSAASAYFNRTPASAGNRKTWTWSGWVKRGTLPSSGYYSFLGADSGGGQSFYIAFDNSTQQLELGQGVTVYRKTTQVFRDPSAWYHLVINSDTTQATASNRLKIYVNGVQVTAFATSNDPSLNGDWALNNNVATSIGADIPSTGARNYFDGYMTEVNFIDGQALTPSSFGETNPVTGVWQPKKYTGTYGTNGFYLNFSDNSAATAAAIGKDYSGNGNNWTPNNISVTAGATYDSMLDVPTQWADGGNGRGNYAVLNVLGRNSSSYAITDGNLRASFGAGITGSPGYGVLGSFAPTFPYYYEVYITTNSNANLYFGASNAPATCPGFSATSWSWAPYSAGSNKYTNSTQTAYGSAPASNGVGAVFGIAVDPVNGKIYVRDSTGWMASSDPVAGTNPMFSGLTGDLFPAIGMQSGSSQTTDASVNFGQRPFSYTPPSGFKALNTLNLPTPTINNGALYMAASIYTGTGANLSITNTVNNVSFQPDLVWIKSRSNALDHKLTDSVRGTTKALISNTTGAETTDTTGLTAFNSNGFTVGTGTQYNANASVTYVGWQWQAGAGSSSSNTSGSITSTVSVNPTAGFSVVTYTGTGVAATVGHGLGVTPQMFIVKSRSVATGWPVYHAFDNASPATGYMALQTTDAFFSSTAFNNTAPTSTVFSVGGAGVSTNNSAATYVAYCWAAVPGYSAFGSYTGNGSSDGPFVFCGFRPRFVMVKRTDAANDWVIMDTSRLGYNQTNTYLEANTSDAETTDSGAGSRALDILSNGFKNRDTSGAMNASGGTYIYAAFAENPLKFSLAR